MGAAIRPVSSDLNTAARAKRRKKMQRVGLLHHRAITVATKLLNLLFPPGFWWAERTKQTLLKATQANKKKFTFLCSLSDGLSS